MSLGERLQSGTLLLDGGLGSLLMSRGLPAGCPPERWVLENPDAVLQAHAAYALAGSDAIHACTFGANRLRLEPFGLAPHLEVLNREAVRLARAAGAPFVLGDLGPTGEYLPPVGKGDPVRWKMAFVEQARILADAGVDGFHLETFSDLREARLALEALAQVGAGLPILASMTFDKKKRGFFTVMGDPLLPSLQALSEAGAQGVGANCTLMSQDYGALAEQALGLGLPLVLQPNAGQPRVTPEGIHYDQDPAAFAADVLALAARGVRAIGGCCGTDPAFISLLRRGLDG